MKHSALLFGVASLMLAACNDTQSDQPTSDAGWRIETAGGLNDFFDCIDDNNGALVSAHRGGPAAGLPENSLEALQATMAAIPAIMEIDVAATADNVLVLMHDDTLERTTAGSGRLTDRTWREVKDLQLIDNDGRKTDFTPPSFESVLRWAVSRTVLQIDFKRSARYEDVINEIYRQDAEDRVILIAYSLGSAQKLHRLAPDMMISLSMGSLADYNAAIAAGLPADRLLAFTGTKSVRPDLLETLDARDVEGIFGSLGGRYSIDQEIARSGNNKCYVEIADAGVDIIATDRPRAAFAALEKAGKAGLDAACGISR